MEVIWEEEKDKFRRVVQCIVAGIVEGYYYEDTSDPGIYVAWVYSPQAETYVPAGTYRSENKAKKILKSFCGS